MLSKRERLQTALCRYVTATLDHVKTVRGFCERLSRWTNERKSEIRKMKHKEISQQDLAAVLKATLGGLEELHHFLEAVELLAVTSLPVFTGGRRTLRLPNPENVQVVIIAARIVCPLLLVFKREASAFFLPKLQNVEVLSYQLDKYTQTTQNICEKLQKSSFSDSGLQLNSKTLVHLDVGLSEDDIEKMLCHINQLDEIRKDQHFRTVFLFQGMSCSGFIKELNERRPRMLQCLADLEQSAVQLDRMNKGAKISSVAGSSVGAAGGLLSIAGLALIPFTAGVSLGLIIGGTSLGITSGVNSVVTTTTELCINSKQQNKANENFQSFMRDVQTLQDCLEEVSNQPAASIQVNAEYLKKVMPLIKVGSVIKRIYKSTDSLATDASALKAVRNGRVICNASSAASDIPDVGQAAVKGSLALSKSARIGLIGVNALFVGMDVFTICKDSISLAKGSETEASQFIRARGALWHSEVNSWQKIHDFLCKGQPTSEKNKDVLEAPFYSSVGGETRLHSYVMQL